MRRVVVALLLALASSAHAEPVGTLELEIYQPASGAELLLERFEPDLRVEGGAAIFGGVRQLDLFLVMDSSKSLLRTDRRDYRVAGAVGLVESLPAGSDIQLGVVDFDRKAKLLQPLTADRTAVIAALRGLDRKGSTNLAAGIRAALEGFEAGARPGSSRVILLFTDGKSNEDKARAATREALARGVAIHTLLLGSDEEGERLLDEIAAGAGGSGQDRTQHDRHAQHALTLAGMYGPGDMPLCYVSDFMREYAGQFIFISGGLEESCVDPNKASR